MLSELLLYIDPKTRSVQIIIPRYKGSVTRIPSNWLKTSSCSNHSIFLSIGKIFDKPSNRRRNSQRWNRRANQYRPTRARRLPMFWCVSKWSTAAIVDQAMKISILGRNGQVDGAPDPENPVGSLPRSPLPNNEVILVVLEQKLRVFHLQSLLKLQ